MIQSTSDEGLIIIRRRASMVMLRRTTITPLTPLTTETRAVAMADVTVRRAFIRVDLLSKKSGALRFRGAQQVSSDRLVVPNVGLKVGTSLREAIAGVRSAAFVTFETIFECGAERDGAGAGASPEQRYGLRAKIHDFRAQNRRRCPKPVPLLQNRQQWYGFRRRGRLTNRTRRPNARAERADGAHARPPTHTPTRRARAPLTWPLT